MEVSATAPNRVYVKCHSAAPDYNPLYQTFTLTEEGWMPLFVALTNGGSSYSNEIDSVIVQAGQEDYIISVDRNLYELILQQDSARNDPASVNSLSQYCDKVTNLQKAPPFFHAEYEEEEPQVIVDCYKDGLEQRLAIPFDTVYHDVDILNTRVLHNVAGRLVLSESDRFIFVSNASITVIDQYNVDNLPLIRNFEQNIDNVDLLIADILLIEMDGEPLRLLNLSKFQVSETNDGITTILGSTGYCPEGHCVAHAVDGNYLLTFAQHPSNEAYFETLFVNLLDGHTAAKRYLFHKTDISQICFFQPLSVDEESLQIYTEHTLATTYKSDIEAIPLLPWYYVVPIVIITILLLILAAVVLICLHNKRKKRQSLKGQSTELGLKSELVVSKRNSETFLQCTDLSQYSSNTKEDSTSDYSSKDSTDSKSLSSQTSSQASQSTDNLSVNDNFEPVKQHDESRGRMCTGL